MHYTCFSYSVRFTHFVYPPLDLDKVRRILEAKYPKLPVIYTLTDVCRSELLIEIEGVGLLQ